MHDHDRLLFIGLGLASATLITHLLKNGFLGEICVIEKENAADTNKRWCAWQPLPDDLAKVVSAQWNQWSVHESKETCTVESVGQGYVQVHARDFWNAFFKRVDQAANVRLIYEQSLPLAASTSELHHLAQKLCGWPVDLILDSRPPTIHPNSLQQQFVGYVVETKVSSFDPQCAQLMHFDHERTQTIAFTYCLPYSAREALIEYTRFDSSTFDPPELQQSLIRVMKRDFNLDERDYTIKEVEQGCLPMGPLECKRPEPGYWPIGTASGMLRASSGYGLVPIHQHAIACATSILARSPLPVGVQQNRLCQFLDQQFCKVLQRSPKVGRRALFRAFKYIRTSTFICLMRGEITMKVAVKTIWAMPKCAFIRILLRSIIDAKA
jgi:lycopene beta-cyclase